MAAEPNFRKRVFGTIRARATLGAVAVVAVVLVVVGLVQLRIVERHLIDVASRSAETQATDLATRIAADGVPANLVVADDDEAFLQVVDARGRSLAASENVEVQRRIVPIRADFDLEDDDDLDFDAESRTFSDVAVDDGGRWSVAAVGVNTDAGPVTVYAGATLEEVDSTIATIRRSLVIGIPFVLAVVGAVTLMVVRRALRPVDAMRRELDDITTRDLDRRVVQPDTDDEIAQLAAAMNRLLDRLETAIARERQFVGDASHELRSPLAALRTQLDVALAHPERADWQLTLGGALRDTQRLQALADDLLFLARLDSDAPLQPAVAVDLGELVAEVLSDRVRSQSIEVHARLTPGVVVLGRPNHLSRAIRNLLDNAIRHAASSVIVRVAGTPKVAVVEVADDGAGIAAADRVRVFERFTRLDHARTRDDGGAGLGLAITRDIVLAHGGRIEITDPASSADRHETSERSEHSTGTTVRLEIPIATAGLLARRP